MGRCDGKGLENDSIELLERSDIVKDFVVSEICVDVFKMNIFREDVWLFSIILTDNWLWFEIGWFCGYSEVDLIFKVYRCVIECRWKFLFKIRFWEI